MNVGLRKWLPRNQGAFLLACLLLSVMLVGIAHAQPTLVSPDYRRPILTPESQAATIWTNVVPNALADYFTYVPFKNADAVKLGFPNSCGNPTAAGATAADLASTDDCYTISAKKFQQQLALPGIFGGGAGLIDPATGLPYGAVTWVYGYGSGGQNWTPPYVDTSKPGVVPGVQVTGNAPAPFTNGTFATTGIWHFPAPTIKGTKGRPVRIQWLNELPNEKPTGFDPTVCGSTPSDCYPYNRLVWHVHGSHVGPESDGQVHGWFTPGFAEKGILWESTRQHGPEGTYYYPMDQEAGTIWYHDHAIGVTHNNTNMGLAGFFPVTDANEKQLQTNNILPTGARELGLALQDRVFYDTGQLAMPDAPIIDAAHMGTCIAGINYNIDPVTGDIPVVAPYANCAPLFMKASDGHLIPYATSPGNPAPQAYLATSATLEFFGNIPVVNGVTYGKYNVDRGVYRIRFIGGTDSRTWALRLKVAGSNPARYLPFWQIASEQGLLNNPAKLDNLVLMPGERIDVLVDFNTAEALDDTGASVGPLNLANARIILENWGSDAPYGGEPILPANDPAAIAFRSLDIPEIMAFDVSAVSVPVDVATPSTATALRPIIPPVPNPATLPPAGTLVRTVSLVEITDQYQRVMPTLDGRGFLYYGVSELPKLNATEQWDIINTTVDAHPMHLHLVSFQLINRETIDTTCPNSVFGGLCVNPASTALAPPYTPASVTAFLPNSIETPLPFEIGYKDTILCPPGKVTRVIATFDVPGTYVWHCHILSHEEHDMMRPLVVTTPAASLTLNASGIVQPTGATMAPVTLTAQAFTGIAAHPVGHGFEYDFAVTGPGNPPQPTRAAPPFGSSLGDSFNIVNVANWTPPTTPGDYTITARTKAMGPVDAGNPIQSATITFTVAGPLAITTTTLPGGNVGTPYSQTLAATGGMPSYAWSVSAGALPPGLALSSAGVISGTPTAVGTFNFTVMVSDTIGSTPATQALSIVIAAPLPVTITTSTLPGGAVGVPYSQQLAATGGVQPYTWARISGTLPPGLTLSSAGVISGTPTAAGVFTFTVRVTAANGATATKGLSIAIASAPPAAPTILTAATSSAGRNMVSWIDHSNNETGFTVWCSVNGATATQIATVLSTASETKDVERAVDFYHVGVSKRNTYTYYVMAFNAVGSSAPSNSATASFTLPTAPTLTSVTAVRATTTTDKVKLKWTPVTNATSFTVQRANNPTFTVGVSTTAGLQALFTSTTQTVPRNRTFYYRVKAVNGLGSSNWSNVKSVVTP